MADGDPVGRERRRPDSRHDRGKPFVLEERADGQCGAADFGAVAEGGGEARRGLLRLVAGLEAAVPLLPSLGAWSTEGAGASGPRAAVTAVVSGPGSPPAFGAAPRRLHPLFCDDVPVLLPVPFALDDRAHSVLLTFRDLACSAAPSGR